ncbi:MAG TPA: glycosyltransferase family 4 protein [Methylomirabilota bacterium]|nr:glycosyltransferase family 4 protein [Methylomirabilota bacterium]
MKIGLICRPFSFHGGVETSTAGLLGALVGCGHEVELISARRQPDVPGVRVRRVPTLRSPSALRMLSFALTARRVVARHGYDVVQSHERTLAQDLYRAGEGCHRAYLAAMGRRAGANPYHRLVCALEGRIFRLRSARHVVAIARRGKEEIERLYGTDPGRVTLVYNGVDLERFHPEQRARHRKPTRERLGIAESAWTLLFVGSGFERKGLGPLLEGFARLADPARRLIVAGKGDVARYRGLAASLGVADRVVWTGPVPDVERLYAAADAVALPALYEPFGNVHLEALASGVPVLSSAHAGGSEVLRRGENGWVVGEPAAGPIAEGLTALRDAPVGGWAEPTRASVLTFTYAAQARAFIALYQQLSR